MAFIIKDRVKETTTSTGTGAVSLGGADDTFEQFQTYMSNGDTTYYAIVHTSSGVDEWEVGVGTWNTGNTLTRTNIIASSNSNNVVSFSAGDKDIFITSPASKSNILDDNGNADIEGKVHIGEYVDFDAQTSHPSFREGRFWYDNIHKTLNYYSDDSDVVHEIGLEEHQRVYNNTGSTISKGKPLYFSGNYSNGSLDVPTVGLADATDVNAYNAQGLAASDIPNNSFGYCIIAGQLDGLDTSGLLDGTNFFVGLTPGAVQNASPTYPNFPMCLGWVVESDATNGVLLVNQQNHSVNSFRVRTDTHIGGDLTIDGNLNVLGTTSTTSTSDVTAGAPFYRANEGDAIGEAGTNTSGVTGLDDAFFAGHFTGTTPTTYYVKIDSVGTPDTFAVSTDNFATTISTGNAITGSEQMIHSADNISVTFGATTGHTLNDVWVGTASPNLVDTGFWSNRNTGTTGVGYTHMGLWYDVSDSVWNLTDEYDPTPSGTINKADSSYVKGTLVADITGDVTGDLTGDVIGNTAGTHTGGVVGDVTGSLTLGTSDNITFEGSTDDTFETTLTVDNPTADRTITFPDLSGDVAIIQTTGDLKVAGITPSIEIDSEQTGQSKLVLQKGGSVDLWELSVDPDNNTPFSSFKLRVDNTDIISANTTDTIINGKLTVDSTSNAYHSIRTTGSYNYLRIQNNTSGTGNLDGFMVGASSNNAIIANRITNGGKIAFYSEDSSGTYAKRADIGEDGLYLATEGFITFEGATDGFFETKLTVADPTSDHTVTLPNASGTVALLDNNGNLLFDDSEKITFGSGFELQISHLSSNYGLISAIGTSNGLRIRGNDIVLQSAAQESYISAVANGAVTLFYDSVAKLATTSTGIDVTGNATFTDNSKAIFGAGSDLQIYHNGNDSVVRDAGTGDLLLGGSTNVRITTSGLGETMALFATNGASTLYYDNAAKIATTSTGIDVTGTVTADGLTVDGTTPFIRLVETDTTDVNTRFRSNAGSLFVQTSDDANNSNTTRFSISHNSGDISFYEDTGTTAKFFWDASAESLGIGTTSPASKLDVSGGIHASGQAIFGKGGGGVSLTINDGEGNANVAFNHYAGVPEQNGQSARITVNTDNTTTNAMMKFQLSSSPVTSGTAITLSDALRVEPTQISIPSRITHLGDTNTYIEFPSNDTFTITTSGTAQVTVDNLGDVDMAGNLTVASDLTVGNIVLQGDSLYDIGGSANKLNRLYTNTVNVYGTGADDLKVHAGGIHVADANKGITFGSLTGNHTFVRSTNTLNTQATVTFPNQTGTVILNNSNQQTIGGGISTPDINNIFEINSGSTASIEHDVLSTSYVHNFKVADVQKFYVGNTQVAAQVLFKGFGGIETNQLLKGKSIEEHHISYNNYSGSQTLNWGDGGFQAWTLAGATTFTFNNHQNGRSLYLYLDTNGYTVTWPTGLQWAGGSAPTLTNGNSHLMFTVIGGSTVGFYLGQAS